MRRVRALLNHTLVGSTVRYGIAGSIVGGVYVGLPLALNGGFGMPIEAAIPIAYAIALTLHFNLQRHFVFRHVEEFALQRRQQILRYLGIAAFQYPTTALATALLPSALHISQRVAYVITVVTISAIAFVVLRTHIFHPADGPGRGHDAARGGHSL
jgi:putative flippase GtrA